MHFTTGGSTAVDTAARMVQYYQSCMGARKRMEIVARDYSYHGSTYLSQSVGSGPATGWTSSATRPTVSTTCRCRTPIAGPGDD